MDSRSRGKRHLPKGLLIEGDVNAPNKAIAQTADMALVKKQTRNWPNTQSTSNQHFSFMIYKAYSEPVGHDDMVENLLLQRDYIID